MGNLFHCLPLSLPLRPFQKTGSQMHPPGQTTQHVNMIEELYVAFRQITLALLLFMIVHLASYM